MIKKATVTDVSGNRVKVYIKDINSVSDWINIPSQKCTIKIGDTTHSNCEYTPKYSIEDNVIVIFNNNLKGIKVVGKVGEV